MTISVDAMHPDRDGLNTRQAWRCLINSPQRRSRFRASPRRRTHVQVAQPTRAQLAAAMPADPVAILRPDFQADFRTNVNNPFGQALHDNNTYSWTPNAPVKMFHCQGDRDVVFANAEVAYQSFTNRGACCVSVVDPGTPAQLNHQDCYNPSLNGVLTWFEALRQ